ncbi:hypothetical protein ACHAWX_003272 [Stephanocyclus meneghinianus]
MGNNLTLQLRDITTLDPHQTIQSKAWPYLNNSMKDDCIFLVFVDKRRGTDVIYNLLPNGHSPSVLANLTPERVRLLHKMEKIKQENKRLWHLTEKEKTCPRSMKALHQTHWTMFGREGFCSC